MKNIKEITEARQQIATLKKADAEAKKAYRKRREIEKQLAMMTGQVFVAIAGWDSDNGSFSEIVGASREVPKIYVRGIMCIKLRDRETVDIRLSNSGPEEFALIVKVGTELTIQAKDPIAEILVDMTLRVCKTKEQADRWLATGTFI